LIKVGVDILLYARQEVRVTEIGCRADLLDGGEMEADLAELGDYGWAGDQAEVG
jgi:hypothetical protein